MLFIACQRLSKSQFHSIFTGPLIPGLPVSSPLSVSIVVAPWLSGYIFASPRGGPRLNVRLHPKPHDSYRYEAGLPVSR